MIRSLPHVGATALPKAARGVFCAWVLGALVGAGTGCLDAETPTGPRPWGPDRVGPVVRVAPSRDTVVDSVGTLGIRVEAHDRSHIATVDLRLVGVGFAFPTVRPADTIFMGQFQVPLAGLSGSRFGFSVRAVDVLDHATVTPTVNVSVQ